MVPNFFYSNSYHFQHYYYYHSYFLTALSNCFRVFSGFFLWRTAKYYWYTKKLGTIIFNSLRFLKKFFEFLKFWFSYKFQAKVAPTFALGSKNLFSRIEFTVQIFVYMDTVQQCHFQFFELFWVILTPKNFSKNLKRRLRYFFATPFNILREKKIQNSEDHLFFYHYYYYYFFFSPLICIKLYIMTACWVL